MYSANAQKVKPISLDAHRISRDLMDPAKSTLSYEVRSITPDCAALILSANPSNEEVDRQAVKTYTDAMTARAWIYNAQPILFDTEGKLLDGRKRLMASVISGESFRTLIVNGIQRDTVHTIDQHRRRSYAGVLEARGIKHAGSLIRTMAKLIRIERGTFGKPDSPASWARYDQVLELNPGIMDAVEMSEMTRGCPLHSTARPVVAFMALQSGKGQLALDLFKAMIDHALLEAGHPAKELALQLAHDRQQGMKPVVDEMIVMGIQALNDLDSGTTPDAPYGWTRDYGECRLDDDGAPLSRKAFMEDTPPNLRMPLFVGYPGIDLGAEVMDATSVMIDGLRSKGNAVPVNADLRLVYLTPDVAAQWLERFNTSNRNIQMTHVNSIARDIRSGNWMMNAQPIAFAGDPFSGDAQLLNGQHRLEAVVKAESGIEVMIATGIAPEAFATFDMHARHAHRKYIAKGDERVLAAAAKLQWRVDNNLAPADRSAPSSTEIEMTIRAHPELMEAFPISRKKEMQEIGSAGILTFFIAHIRRQDDQLSEIFLQQMMDGEGLSRGNPLIKVRSKLIGKRGSLTRRQVLGLLLDTWDEYRAHVDVHGMEAVTGFKGKKLPTFDEMMQVS
ncbi:hypothetical protein ACGYLO_18190 [Sulfitobacter sp. 1A13353]|jgi:hypothetical protein|uniref:hypothetical protein n=1 Tax=Sulfitobacter sp. 1A13353 TaxID=3368568 RepID=UPI0037471702